VAASEFVVLHHEREAGIPGGDEARPSASTAYWAAQKGSVAFVVVKVSLVVDLC
jgi:hypothetical protein